MKTINYGILGPGHIAAAFCQALEADKNSKICAIGSRDGRRAESFARQFNAQRAYGDYESLAMDPEVDVIYVATPHSFHEEQTLMCLENKKAVLCEKPMALTYASTRNMVEASQSSNKFLMEGMWSCFNPAVRRAKALVEGGTIGEVTHLSADFGFRKAFDPRSRLYDLALGGGSMLDVGVYPLFLALFMLGKPDDIKCTAHLAKTGADISCSVQLGYANGVSAQLYSSMISETKKEAVITGTEGSITIHTPWYKAKGVTITRGIPGKGPVEDILLPYEGNGFEFQVQEVNRCLSEARIESTLMPHAFSLLKATVSDEVLRQAGVKYPV